MTIGKTASLGTKHSQFEYLIGRNITSWEIDRETVEIVSDFILGASKITADGAPMKLKDTYSLEEKL